MQGGFGIKLARFAIVLAIFALWELLSRSGIVNPRLLPSASDTLVTLGDLLQRAAVRKDLVVTATEVVTAFALAVPVGALIGYLIADLYEMPAEIAALEYENTIMKLETSGDMSAADVPAAVQLSLDLAKLGGLKDIVPTEDVISTRFKPVPTKP